MLPFHQQSRRRSSGLHLLRSWIGSCQKTLFEVGSWVLPKDQEVGSWGLAKDLEEVGSWGLAKDLEEVGSCQKLEGMAAAASNNAVVHVVGISTWSAVLGKGLPKDHQAAISTQTNAMRIWQTNWPFGGKGQKLSGATKRPETFSLVPSGGVNGQSFLWQSPRGSVTNTMWEAKKSYKIHRCLGH